MKSTKLSLKDILKNTLQEAEDAANPLAGSEESDAKEDDKDQKEKPKASTDEKEIPITFNLSKVKQYNQANFLSNSGVVKSINKDGIVVTTKPDDVDVLVNFEDITESVKKFFKDKK